MNKNVLKNSSNHVSSIKKNQVSNNTKLKKTVNSKVFNDSIKKKNFEENEMKKSSFKKINSKVNDNVLKKKKIEDEIEKTIVLEKDNYYESDFESDDDQSDEIREADKKKESPKKIRPQTTQLNKLKFRNDKAKNEEYEMKNEIIYKKINEMSLERNNRTKDLLSIIKLSKVDFELFKIDPISYDQYMQEHGSKKTKQVSIQTKEFQSIETQTDKILYVDKSIQLTKELKFIENFNQLTTNNELIKLKNFLLKSEKILKLILITDSKILKKSFNFGQMFEIDLKNNQLITFHSLNCFNNIKNPNILIFFWKDDQYDFVLYCRELITSKIFLENNLFIFGTDNGTILIYDLNTYSQIKTNLNLPDIKIDGLEKEKLINCCFSTIFINDDLQKSKIVNLEKIEKKENFSKTFYIISLDLNGNFLIWKLEKILDKNISFDPDLGKGMLPLSKFKLNLIQKFNLMLDVLSNKKIDQTNLFNSFKIISNDKIKYLLPFNDNFDSKILLIENNQIIKKFNFLAKSNNLFIENKKNNNFFLTYSEDGTINLFSLKKENSIYMWQLKRIKKLKWLDSSLFCSFIVLEKQNKILIFDLVQDFDKPSIIIEKKKRIVDICILSNINDNILYIGFEDGSLSKETISNLRIINNNFEKKLNFL